MITPISKKKHLYFDTKEPFALNKFTNTLTQFIADYNSINSPIIVFCIGTDRATGDSLGPIIGYKLSKIPMKHVYIYGTLKNPIHAKNLEETILLINNEYPNNFKIAIDACLGKSSHIGSVHLGEGPLLPGSGVNKILPPVGDIYITGIVNFSSHLDQLVLQSTRLNTVMELADFVVLGLRNAFYKTQYQKEISS